MSRVNIQGNNLVITMQGARKFFALKSEISVPLENIAAVESGLNWKDLPGLLDKIAGANLNSFYYGGYFRQDGDKVFYDLKRKEDAVVITLKDGDFDTLVIGVDDPITTVETIKNALN